jgi:hypothetical protein
VGLARLDEVERDGGRVLVEQLLEEAREREQRAGRRGEDVELAPMREGSGKVQGSFREASGKVQGKVQRARR